MKIKKETLTLCTVFILALITGVVFGYFRLFSKENIIIQTFTPSKKIVVEKEETLTSFIGEIKPNSAKSYTVRYQFKDFNETYLIQKLIFQDSVAVDDFAKIFLTKMSDFTSTSTSIEIDSFEGEEFITLSVDSKSPLGYGMVIKKDNILITASGRNRDNLLNVVTWFTKTY